MAARSFYPVDYSSESEEELVYGHQQSDYLGFNPQFSPTQTQQTQTSVQALPKSVNQGRNRPVLPIADTHYNQDDLEDDSFAVLEGLINRREQEKQLAVSELRQPRRETTDIMKSESEGEQMINPSVILKDPDNLDSSLVGMEVIHESVMEASDRNHEYVHNLMNPTASSTVSSAFGIESTLTPRMKSPPRMILKAIRAVASLPLNSSMHDETRQNALLETNRRFTSNSTQVTQIKKAPTETKVRPIKVVRSKSIVGCRPKHWESISSQPSLLNNDRFASLSRKRKDQVAVDLKRATDSRIVLPKSAVEQADASHHKQSDQTSSVNNNAADYQNPPPITFAPSFLFSSPPATTAASNSDDVFPNDDVVAAELPMLSPPPSKRTIMYGATKCGPLVKRLRSIRAALKGDEIRFQSGQYPFSTCIDMNNPRAGKDFIDMTVLTITPNDWEKEFEHLTILGYIHFHGCPDKTISSQNVSNQLAWFVFRHSMVPEWKLEQNTSLRLYSPVITALPQITESPVSFVVSCTQLGELHSKDEQQSIGCFNAFDILARHKISAVVE